MTREISSSSSTAEDTAADDDHVLADELLGRSIISGAITVITITPKRSTR